MSEEHVMHRQTLMQEDGQTETLTMTFVKVQGIEA